MPDHGQDPSPTADRTDTGGTALEDLLRRQIAAEGPISVADYMGLALGHPLHGYYTTRDPFGAAGDFVTAPEISQMFGELIGLWCAQTWIERGRPGPVTLIELGPGRGTLMADSLRALSIVPDFRDALTIRLVETSPVLRQRQAEAIDAAAPDVPRHWHGTPAPALEAAEGFVLMIANEFFDALPIRQFVRGAKGWHERMVGLDGDDRLAFHLSPDAVPLPPAPFAEDAAEGAVREWSRAGEAVMASMAETLIRQTGAALIIDYGHAQSGLGDTLQAVRRHASHPPLAAPGTADLTAHVDFGALTRAASLSGARAHGPLTQGAFLNALGIGARADALARSADDAQRQAIASAHKRLTGAGAMGTLFKVLAVTDPDAAAPPAFAERVAPDSQSGAPHSEAPHSAAPPAPSARASVKGGSA